METATTAELEQARKAIASMKERSEKAQQKFAPGTAQHTLQENRIQALSVAFRLIGGALAAQDDAPAREELEKAKAPLASLASKSEKAQTKLKPGTWQHAMLADNIKALRIALSLLEKAPD